MIIQLAGASANIPDRLIYSNLPATSLLPDGRTLCLKLLQRIELPFPLFSCRSFPSFGHFVPWTSMEFTCGNSLTSFLNCWAFVLVYLCIWDPITNPFLHMPVNRTGYDQSGVFYFSVICHVHHPSEAFLIANLHETSSVSQNRPILKVLTPSFAQLHEVTRFLVPCFRTFQSL